MEQTQLALPAHLQLAVSPTPDLEWSVVLREFNYSTKRWEELDRATSRSWHDACHLAATMLDYQAELGY